jgi:3-oxoisoapionate decarboxylase
LRDVKLWAGCGVIEKPRIGLCTYSCYRAWAALAAGAAGVPFRDGPSFYDYARKLGAAGVQCEIGTLSLDEARSFRDHVERTGGYFEGDIALPKSAADLPAFDHALQLVGAAGGSVARCYFTLKRRYEAWASMAAFTAFAQRCERRLELAEPLLRQHRMKLAVENHKDFTAAEQVAMLRKLGSEWVGINVDTGNNLALLEDPHEAIETLAPLAFSVHLKDMAMQPYNDGFLLSEVPLGRGCLDLPRVMQTLLKANPALRFNLEMVTRDPLRVPCLRDDYFIAMPERRVFVEKVMSRAKPCDVPSIAGLSWEEQLRDEELNNRECLSWK